MAAGHKHFHHHHHGHEGLYVDVWEADGGDVWEITHQFNAGLELDCHEAFKPGSKKSRVHLPTMSLAALQHLRTSLLRPQAISLGVKVGHSGGFGAALALLLEAASDVMSDEARQEAFDRLRDRFCAVPEAEDMELEVKSINSEVLITPEKGREAVDISVLPLEAYSEPAPIVVIAQLERPVRSQLRDVPLRFVALVISSKKGAPFAVDVAKSCAVTFLDDAFVSCVSRLPEGATDRFIGALDSCLSALTIVPTVYFQTEENPHCSGYGLEQQRLEDSICEQMEKLFFDARGIEPGDDEVKIHHSVSNGGKHRVKRCCPLSIEVDEFLSQGAKWRIAHRLRRGLEFDTSARMNRPHLPHISAIALQLARQLMCSESISLNVEADAVESAIDAVLKQLKGAGLPGDAVEEVTKALLDRAAKEVPSGSRGGTKQSYSSRDSKTSSLPSAEALFRPEVGDEACHVLVIACKRFQQSCGIVGVFVRLKNPLSFCFPSTEAPARFLLVFVGPERQSRELSVLGDSLAALASDEDLTGNLLSADSVETFIGAVDEKLNNLTVIPHTHVRDEHVFQSEYSSTSPSEGDDHGGLISRTCPTLDYALGKMQKYSIPLVSGVLLALAWSNIDKKSYMNVAHGYFGDGVQVLGGHTLTLHFFVNDIFMCFFFGLAIKEVTEALLPGGSLSPLKRAVNPLVATFGGVAGPAVAYVLFVCVLWASGAFDGMRCVTSRGGSASHRRLGGAGEDLSGEETEPCTLGILLNGWGVPTATDISLAWMFALMIFGVGHPAINFLLLLAIVDDAIGMVIIAVCYPDPDHPVEPVWLLLVVVAMGIAFALRKLVKCEVWWPYIVVAGPVSWLGLIKAHVHPALALVFVVPFMPASRAIRARGSRADLGAWDPSPARQSAENVAAFVKNISVREQSTMISRVSTVAPRPTLQRAVLRAQTLFSLTHVASAPLHAFEHQLKLPVDLGMFLFGFANAGVELNNVGGMTASVLFALIVGKTVGIAGCSLIAVKMGFGLPAGVSVGDLFAMSALGGIGLTVALFVANEAFVDPTLQGQAKFAAVLSVCSAGVAKLFHMVAHRTSQPASDNSLHPSPEDDKSCVEDQLVDELLQMMWMQRKYERRGVLLNKSPASTPTPRTPAQLTTHKAVQKAWQDESVLGGTSPPGSRKNSPAASIHLTPVVPGAIDD